MHFLCSHPFPNNNAIACECGLGNQRVILYPKRSDRIRHIQPRLRLARMHTKDPWLVWNSLHGLSERIVMLAGNIHHHSFQFFVTVSVNGPNSPRHA